MQNVRCNADLLFEIVNGPGEALVSTSSPAGTPAPGEMYAPAS
jgi:hypothetical protein